MSYIDFLQQTSSTQYNITFHINRMHRNNRILIVYVMLLLLRYEDRDF
jgi:hypothetical protein